ncbi:MAG TPA: ABC-F family ATP-binding cassette domain-containing protein, partial [Deinococcales bacterium]|nr:ABC-F family ATP-binding cassette domain-containing protein [Deinococcales bacterium]
LEARMAAGEEALAAWSEALETFERAGGYAGGARAGRAVGALRLGGFLEREANSLSGGERTRLALAAALVDQPDLLVLDEPTNHLDIGMREWLEGHLAGYPGALLVVSHDRALLDAVAQETWHLERGRLSTYRGGYTRAREQRLEDRRLQDKHARLGKGEVRRLERAAGQVAAWGRNNERLAKRARAIARRAERAREGLVEAPLRERQITMALAAGDARARTLLRADHLSKAYGERVILRDARLRVRAGDRIALLAPNGAGKTTLLRLLLGEAFSDDPVAEVRFSEGVQPAYFDQTYHGLSPKRPLLAQLALRVGEGPAKALLGRYGFRPEDWPKRPAELSGGERARAGLALVAATRADLLVLDEPTNHLDVETLELLEDALSAYPGSLLFVTHDRSFAGHVATRVLGIEEQRLVEYEGGFEGYQRARRGDAATVDPGRLLVEEEQPPPEPEDPAARMDRLEDRLARLDESLLRRDLSEREAERLRRDRDDARETLSVLYAERWGAPLEFSHAARSGMLTVLADPDGEGWRFWAREADGCPQLAGRSERGIFRLEWQGETEGALAWFRRSLLEGAAVIALEHLGAPRVLLPPGDDGAFARCRGPLRETSVGRLLERRAYEGWLGFPRPLPARVPRLRFHPRFEDWARARAYRKARRRLGR